MASRTVAVLSEACIHRSPFIQSLLLPLLLENIRHHKVDRGTSSSVQAF